MRKMDSDPRIEIRGATKRYDESHALHDVTLTVDPGEVLALLGPSGSGKSTLLHIIAGLVEPDAGSVTIGGLDMTHVPAHKRCVPIVFQKHGLFPHLRVIDNVAFGLRMMGMSRAERYARAREALADVQLAGLEKRFPSELSGGQAQRVAIARALVTRSRILLFDEPFSNLDATLRTELQDLLVELRALKQLTAIFVTHDQREALRLGDRIAILKEGRLLQVGKARDVYDQPADEETARFLGLTNVLAGRVADGRLDLDGIGSFVLPPGSNLRPGARVRAAFRPEHVRLDADAGGAGLVARVAAILDHGQTVTYRLGSAAGALEAVELGPPRFAVGSRVRLKLTREPRILPASPLDETSNGSAAPPDGTSKTTSGPPHSLPT